KSLEAAFQRAGTDEVKKMEEAKRLEVLLLAAVKGADKGYADPLTMTFNAMGARLVEKLKKDWDDSFAEALPPAPPSPGTPQTKVSLEQHRRAIAMLLLALVEVMPYPDADARSAALAAPIETPTNPYGRVYRVVGLRESNRAMAALTRDLEQTALELA